ncbi:MAG: HlyD family secretion protein [Scytonema sp. PMC 1069.18]|nr:HlyD family secretion protein [Scytonema sp. PMC 1069.18]MEC4880126.1 HlyD family secretion protein [Scytonema sp. PMC 1070.18]
MESLNSSQQTHPVAEMEEQHTPVSQHEETAIAPTDSNTENKNYIRHLLPKVALGGLIGLGIAASGVYGYRQWQYAQNYEVTDNAYVTANIQPVTSRISGIVTEVAVKDNQMVSPGTVLVKLDPRGYEVSLTEAKASLELAKQQAALAKEKTKLVAVNIPDPVSQGGKAASKSNALQLQAINQQKEINAQEYKTAQSAIAQKEAELKKAQLDLSYTKITSLVAGKIGNKNVQVGQQVQPGQTLIEVVQPNPWIVANFKESQLENIKPGQKVGIKIAAFPSRKFQGTIDSMSPTSFGRFTPLPQNNTSNPTQSSDVQRIPVKITFDPESIQDYQSRMTPGMSAVVTVNVK